MLLVAFAVIMAFESIHRLFVPVALALFACAVALTERARMGRLALRDNGRWLQGVCTGSAGKTSLRRPAMPPFHL